MNDVVAMKVAESLESLAKISKSFRLSEDGFSVLVIEEITPFSILHYHINVAVF